MIGVYSFQDIKAQTFGNPFYAVNNQTAIRILSGVLYANDSYIARFPEDYKLYKIGEFDDSTGRLIPLELLEYITSADIVALSLSTGKDSGVKGLQNDEENSEFREVE